MTTPGEHPMDPVAIASMTSSDYAAEFTSWIRGMARYDVLGQTGYNQDTGQMGGHFHWIAGGDLELVTGPRVAEARCQITEKYCTEEPFRKVPWLLWVDADMEPPVDGICRLLAASQAIDGNKPKVIGGLCFAGGRSGTIYPTIYKSTMKELDNGETRAVVERQETYPRNSIIKVAATGAAFMMVHRRILMHMAQPYPTGFGTDSKGTRNPHPWFTEGIEAGLQFGEDVAFCQRVSALGYPIYVDTSIKVGHMKRHNVNEEAYDRYLKERPAVAPRNRKKGKR